MHSADLAIPCGTAEHALWVRQAIQSEVDEAPDGATCTIQANGAELSAHVEAGELAALRASINTVVRLADTALRTLQAGPGRRNPPTLL